MADRFRDEERGRAYRSGFDEEHDIERGDRRRFEEDRNFERNLRAPFREYGRAGIRGARRDYELESGSRMHFEEDRGGYGGSPRYEYGRYGGRGPRSDYEFGGGGFQRFGDPYGFQGSYSRTPEGTYSADYGPQGYGRGASYGSGDFEGGERRSAFGWDEGRRRPEERGWWDRAKDEVRGWFGDDEPERGRRTESMRGRGPKNYARSDERIRDDICDELTEDPMLDASEIEVQVSNGEVTLSGTVDGREEKRHAEDCADSILGVKNVQNNLRVEEPLELRSREVGTTSGTAGGNVTGTVAGGRARETERT